MRFSARQAWLVMLFVGLVLGAPFATASFRVARKVNGMRQGQHSPLDALLLQAARDGDAETVQHLIRSGANPNARDAQGQSALQIASARGWDEVVQALRERGAR